MRIPVGARNAAHVGALFLLAGGCGCGSPSTVSAGVDKSDASAGGSAGDAQSDAPGQLGNGDDTAGRPFVGDATEAGGEGGNGAVDGAAGVTALAGPLSVSANPAYFQDANGRALILAGSHTWNNLQDWGSAGAPQALDFCPPPTPALRTSRRLLNLGHALDPARPRMAASSSICLSSIHPTLTVYARASRS
jgi:hypothetical protein